MLYPSSSSNEQYMSFPKSLSVLNQSGVLQKRLGVSGTFIVNNIADTIFWYEYNAKSSKLDNGMYILPSSVVPSSDGKISMDVDCDLDHVEAHNRGYTNDSAEWKNTEITSWFFVKEVSDKDGCIFIATRSGMTAGNEPGGCCQATGYGVKILWNNSDADKKGKWQFYKLQMGGGMSELIEQGAIKAGPKFSTFYQHWFGVKFCVYNKTNPDQVRIELWLTQIEFLQHPSTPVNNRWVKVGDTGDFVGRGWGVCGEECGAPTKDYPITWAGPLILFGWENSGEVVQFTNTSFREIDIDGTFGEDPPPPEVPPNFPDPPTTPDPQPPDATPPSTPTSLTRRLTLRREVINNTMCSCDGIQQPDDNPVPPDPPPGGGGGGGGTGTLSQMYNVPLNTSGFARLATVAGSSSYYLRFGQAVTQTSSSWLNKSINRVEITIGKQGLPTGGTGGGIHCRIRKGSDDSIAATLNPVVAATEVTPEGKLFVFENLTNTYKMAFNDKLLFEFDGGDTNNHIKIFRTTQPTTTGTKIMWRANNMDPGEYDDAPDLDLCARVLTLTP